MIIILNYLKNILRNLPALKWFLEIRRQISIIENQATLQTRILQQLYRQTVIEKKIRTEEFFRS